VGNLAFLQFGEAAQCLDILHGFVQMYKFPMGKLGWDFANVMLVFTMCSYIVERLFFLSNCHEETCANVGMIRLSFATCDYF